MLDTLLRPRLQPALNLVGTLFMSMRLNAMTTTFLAFATGMAAAVFLARGEITIACSLMWLSGFFDSIDGTIARLNRKATNWGAYNDLVSDRLVESALIAGFAMHNPSLLPACFAFIVALLFHFSTFLVAGTLFRNRGRKSMHYDPSIVERGEAFVAFTAMMLYPEYSTPILLALTTVITLSAVSRYVRVARFVYTQD